MSKQTKLAKRAERRAQDKAVKKQKRESLFEELAQLCSAGVKSEFPDMRDCHSATNAMKEVLHEKGYNDARVLECSVITGNSSGLISRCGNLSRSADLNGEDPAHSIVVVLGYVIDPTAGQFRNQAVTIPDFLILPPELAEPMLEGNRVWARQEGEDSSIGLVAQKCKNDQYDFAIAYIPRV